MVRLETSEKFSLGKLTLAALEFEQPTHDLPDLPARTDAEVGHHGIAVDLGPLGISAILFRKLGDAALEVVD